MKEWLELSEQQKAEVIALDSEHNIIYVKGVVGQGGHMSLTNYATMRHHLQNEAKKAGVDSFFVCRPIDEIDKKHCKEVEMAIQGKKYEGANSGRKPRYWDIDYKLNYMIPKVKRSDHDLTEEQVSYYCTYKYKQDFKMYRKILDDMPKSRDFCINTIAKKFSSAEKTWGNLIDIEDAYIEGVRITLKNAGREDIEEINDNNYKRIIINEGNRYILYQIKGEKEEVEKEEELIKTGRFNYVAGHNAYDGGIMDVEIDICIEHIKNRLTTDELLIFGWILKYGSSRVYARYEDDTKNPTDMTQPQFNKALRGVCQKAGRYLGRR
jgi:hypothetical protein